MNHKRLFLSRVLLGLWGILFLSLATAHAQFLIEFTDGRQMTVRSYKEEGEKVKVYTPSGSFAFRKGDVKQIVALSQSPRGPQEQPAKAGSELARYLTAVPGTREEGAANPAVEKTPSEPTEATASEKLRDTLQGRNLRSMFQPVFDWLFQLRYLIGLLAFGKLFKMFLLGSAK